MSGRQMDLRWKISQRNKRRENRNKKSRKTNKRKMNGGASNSCLSQYNGSVIPSICGSANIHNTNPQAMGDLDLDNKFKLYGGPVPLGENLVGGGSCGDEGVNTTGLKNSTFKQYIENMATKLDLQNGGGYIVDPSQYIGGMPRIGHYDDCCPPAIVNGQIVQAGPDQPVCGLGAIPPMRGGKRKHNKTKKNNKQNKNKTKKRKNQKGGDFTGIKSSKPASMSDAFSGQPSYFDDGLDLSKRHFDEVQPNYGPLAI